jgi:hypothetical protein
MESMEDDKKNAMVNQVDCPRKSRAKYTQFVAILDNLLYILQLVYRFLQLVY